ncbi:MAG: ABC transporter ATP-binding protein [Deltaproteobacteria bacterium]|nr:ABC transporter ATP-binding protein [Deltaproteobacteria bacterium]MBW2121078.1 ABC transporter ATP-binding protein [Deltaproteobacteria bacterium]
MSEIRLVDLRKEFDDVVAVRDVTITFPSGTVTGLLGPSGCGKTTMMRMIAGLERQTAGEVYFDNERVTDLPPRERRIGMVFQYPVVYRGISVYRNIELPLMEEKLSGEERKRRIQEVVEILGLQESIDKDTAQLDMGTRQKVAVARAVARQPRIILFDEPITNVDVEARVQLKRALKELTKQRDQTVIYVTHDQTEAMTLADQIALMKDGRIVQCDAPRRLYNQPNDVFGGWFLGNPGMNFFDHDVETSDGSQRLTSPLFPGPVEIYGADGARRVTIGIRPEHVRISLEQTSRSVRGRISRKFIVVGGQYLLSIEFGERLLKVKVDPVLGRQVQDEVWVECPLEWVTVFGPDGHRLGAALSVDRPGKNTGLIS